MVINADQCHYSAGNRRGENHIRDIQNKEKPP